MKPIDEVLKDKCGECAGIVVSKDTDIDLVSSIISGFYCNHPKGDSKLYRDHCTEADSKRCPLLGNG